MQPGLSEKASALQQQHGAHCATIKAAPTAVRARPGATDQRAARLTRRTTNKPYD